MLSLRQGILALTMAALGGLAWWQQPGDKEPSLAPTADERRPDYTVDNFTATIMDETGKPHRRLTAVELRHYPGDDSNELERPVLTLFNEDTPPWLIRSETGWVSADGEEVMLHGQVFIDREAGETTRPVQVKTHELYIQPKEEYAETEQPVRTTSLGDWVTSANGAQIWFRDNTRVKLLGRTRARVAIQ